MARAEVVTLMIIASLACAEDNDTRDNTGMVATEDVAGDGQPDDVRVDSGVADTGVDAGIGDDTGELMTPDAGPDSGPPPGPGASARSRARVYFVGHSQVNHNMPAMLQDIARGLGMDHGYDLMIRNGTALRQQWEDTTPGEGRACDGEDGNTNCAGRAGALARQEIPTGDHDVLVMVERVPIIQSIQFECSYAYALEFYNLMMENHPQADVYFYESWPSTREFPAWRDQIALDRQASDSMIVDAVNTPPANAPGDCPHPSPPTIKRAGKPMRVIPAGRALAMLDTAIEAGTVPGITQRSQLFVDTIHMNDLGNYFIALVMYATIYRRDPAGAPLQTTGDWNRRFAAPAANTAARLQQIAWDAVRNDPRAGVRN